MKKLNIFSKEVIERLILQVELFQDFLHDEQEIVLHYLDSFMQFNSGENIITEGQEDDCSIYFLLSGNAKVQTEGNEKDIILDDIKVGEFFGEISFLTEKPRTANVVAIEPCIVWRLDHNLLQNIPISLREKIKDKIIQKLIRIITHGNQQIKSAIYV